MPRLRQLRSRSVLIAFILTTAFAYTYFTRRAASAPLDTKSYTGSTSWTSKLTRSGGHPTYKIQYDFKGHGERAGDPAKAHAVVKVMQRSFRKYREQAWGKDEVRPLSGGFTTSRNGWGATLVDALTTTAVMGLEEEFKMQLDHITTQIDFSTTDQLVDPFETTIRYLGAMVSVVDLIDHGVVPAHWIKLGQRNALLDQAVLLANLLGPAYDTPKGLLWPRVNFTDGIAQTEPEGQRPYANYNRPVTAPANSGTNYLENLVLSKLTGDSVYVRNGTRAWSSMVWNKNKEDMPGLVDGPIDVLAGSPLENKRSWDAGHDSYYEYLIKAYVISPRGRYAAKYRDRWLEAMDSTKKYLLQRARPALGETHQRLFLGQHVNSWPTNEMTHLACFAGGNFMMGGKYVGRDDLVELGAELTDTCHHLYESTTSRIGPEIYSWYPANPDIRPMIEPQGEDQIRQAKTEGFWAQSGFYRLRPETVESYYYAYRITGDKKYQDWAWDAFQAIVKACHAHYGYAEVQDVTKPPGPENQVDFTESFWTAETLKYLYLIFTDEDVMNLDEWVFNTEAHPYKIMA